MVEMIMASLEEMMAEMIMASLKEILAEMVITLENGTITLSYLLTSNASIAIILGI